MSQQFQYIGDLIEGADGSKPLENSSLQRDLISQHLLKSIGVDVNKFLDGPKLERPDPLVGLSKILEK